MEKTNLIFLYFILSLTIQSRAQTLEASNYQWQNVVIGCGGYVTGITFSEAQQNLIYARTDVGGAYRWDESGKSWIQLLNFIGNGQTNLRDVESIGTDPSDANRVYIATGESDYTRILRSTDKGQSFTFITPPFKASGNGEGRGKGERLVVDPNKNNILFYGSRSQGLFKSTDYGSTWTNVSSFPISNTSDGVGVCFIIMDKSSSASGNATNTMYIGVSQKASNLYKSTDAGATWQVISDTPANLQPHNAGLDANKILYISFCDAAGPNGIDSGAVWKYNTTTPAWTNITPPTGQGGFGGIAVDKNKPGTLMASTINRWWPGDQVYRSVDGGVSWKAIDANASRKADDAPYMYNGASTITSAGNWIDNMVIDPFNSDRVMYGTGAGIWACSDVTNCENNLTTNWTFLVKGVEEMGAYGLISPPSGAPLLSVVGDCGGFRHADLKVSPPNGFFKPPGWGTNTSIDFAQNNPNIIVRTYFGGKHGAYSANNGQTWTEFSTFPNGSGQNGDEITISPNGNNIVWAPENTQPYYSANNGVSWTVSSGIPSNYWYSVKSDRVNSNKFYIYHNEKGYVYVSNDGGASFVQSGYVQSWGKQIVACPTVEGDVWVPVWDGLYHSTNSAQSFTKIANVQQATSITFGKTGPGKTYPTLFLFGKVNNEWGYFASVDIGVTWTRINDDEHRYGYDGFIVGDESTYGRVYLSTHCMGIVYGQLKSSVVSVSGISVSPSTASLIVGATIQLTATVIPTNATNPAITWSSNNTSVATVSASGLVTGIKAGTATITVTTQDGSKTSTSIITVSSSPDTPTATEPEPKLPKLNVYPNPSKGNFSVEYLAGKVTIKIYDSEGKMVLEKKTKDGKADFNEHLAPGIYTIRINNNKSSPGKKVIIN